MVWEWRNEATDKPEEVEDVLDSWMTLEEALFGKEIPEDIRNAQALVAIRYVSFDGAMHQGQIVVHKAVAEEVKEIFDELLSHKFPIEVAKPIVAYDWDDQASMTANNTSAFNYRTIAGTDRLSNHAYGLAIDVNPRLNPFVKGDVIEPAGATYDPDIPGTLAADSPAVLAFKKRGWEWGGDWETLKDWQHFEKKLK